jgi:hypothetical protein
MGKRERNKKKIVGVEFLIKVDNQDILSNLIFELR